MVYLTGSLFGKTAREDREQELYEQIAQEEKLKLPSTEPQPSFWEKTFAFLSAGETAPAVEEFRKTGSVSAAVKKYRQTFSERITGKGFKGETTRYEDVLKKTGVEEMPLLSTRWGTVTGRGLLGLAGDIFLDPSTYLTLGLTSLGRKAAKKTFGEAIEKGISREVAEKSPEVIGRTAVEQATKGQRGLINFMGRSLLPKETNVALLEKLTKAGKKLGETPVGEAYDWFRKAFAPRLKPMTQWGEEKFAEKWDVLNELERKYLNKTAVTKEEALEMAENTTKKLRNYLGKTTDIKKYENFMEKVVNYAERYKTVGELDEIPEVYRAFTTDFVKLRNALENRWVKGKGAKLTYDNVAYAPHIMVSDLKKVVKKKGGWGARLVSSQTPSDNPRGWIKVIDNKGNEVVGEINEIKNTLGLTELDVEGLPSGLYSGEEALTLSQLKKKASKMGIELIYDPRVGMGRGGVLKGFYRPLKKRIKIAAGEGLEETLTTAEHELFHGTHGLLGEILELHETFTGRRGGKWGLLDTALTNAKNVAKEEAGNILEVTSPGTTIRNLLKRGAGEYVKYRKEPTELLAWAAQGIYKNADDALKNYPKTYSALEKLKTAYEDLVQIKVPSWKDIPVDKFQAGIDKLFVTKDGRIMKAAGATIDEINKVTNKIYGVKLFSTNIPLLEYSMATRVGKKEAGEEFFRLISDIGVPAKNAPTGWRALALSGMKDTPELVKSTAKELRDSGLVFPNEIAERIDEMYKAYFTDEAIEGVKKVYDDIQNFWKGTVTVVFPAFHGRNFLSNIWQNFLGGVKNPTVYLEAGKIRTKIEAGLKLTDDEAKIWEKFVNQGLKGFGFYGADIEKRMAERLFTKGTLIGKATSLPFQTLEAGRELGEVVEDTARLAHFIDKLKKGFSDTTAASSVRKYLFDYADLTPFEKNVLKRFFPFYTFTRKNLPMELEALLTQPGKFTGLTKVMQEAGFGTEEKEYLPSWLKRTPAMLKEGGRLERWMYGLDIPAFEIANLIEEGPKRTLEKSLGRMLSPILKTPLEIATQRHMYFGKPLEETASVYKNVAQVAEKAGLGDTLGLVKFKNKKGEIYYRTTKPELWHLFKSFFSRFYTQMGKPAEYKNIEERMAEFLFGISTKEIEPEKEKEYRAIEATDKIGDWLVKRGYLKEFKTKYKPKVE